MKLITFIANFFQESDGSSSMTRLTLFFAVVVIVGTWAFISIRNGKLETMPVEVTAILGIFASLKYGQRRVEDK